MMESTTTPATAKFIPADDSDDDIDEDALPAFEGASLSAEAKGKGRAFDTSTSVPGSGPSSGPAAPTLSGTIGSNANANAPKQNTRRTVGGVQVETRYVILSVLFLAVRGRTNPCNAWMG